MSRKFIDLGNSARLATERRTRIDTGADGDEATPRNQDFQHTIPTKIGEVPLPLFDYLETSAPSIEMAVDGTTPKEFNLTPGSSAVYRVESLVLVAVLSSVPSMTQFGNLAALSVGIALAVLDSDGETIVDLTGGEAIKSNNDLAALGKFEVFAENSTYAIRWEFTPRTPLRLEGADSEKLRLTVSDNLSSLTRMRMLAHGINEGSALT